MTFRYFAYGSNMLTQRMQDRCPSARTVGTAVLAGWRAVYDKPSKDGSAKLNIRPDAAGSVEGVLYDISDDERADLDRFEGGYTTIEPPVGLTYVYSGAAATVLPAPWYVAIVEEGAQAHGLTPPEPPDIAE